MALRRITGIVGIAAAFTAMLVGGTSNYLLVHSLVETLSAVVAVAVFLLAWNARRLLRQEPFLLRIGIILLFVGVVDVLHALSYRGMGVFAPLTPGGDTVNLATQLWLVGRFLFAAALALALLLSRRAVRPPLLLAAGATVTATLTALVFSGAFPACFRPGTGLTPFKIGAEAAVCGMLAAAGLLLWRRRTGFDPRLVRSVGWAIGLSVASELAFMLYGDPYALANSVGHALKVAAYVMLYRALVQLGLREPYAVLFRELKRSETALAQANRTLEARVAERTDALEKRQAQLRLLARELTLVARRERRRVATMIHDDLAQLLVAAKMRLGVVEGGHAQERQRDLAVLSDLIEDALMVTRNLISELVPHRLDTGGVSAAVHALADDMACRYDARVEVAADPELPELPPETQETVFNAVRELLANAAKHSGAANLRVTLTTPAPGRLLAVVEDDGSGFDPDTLDVHPGSKGGFGLFNLREQIDLVGGELRLASARGAGTRAEVVVPAERLAPTS